MKHLLLEVYCDCEDNDKPPYCLYGIGFQGIHCFDNKCKFLSYTYCPNEIAYSNEIGLIENEENFIGFGGEMDSSYCDNSKYTKHRKLLINQWKCICNKKISEAYNEFMKIKKNLLSD